MSIDIPDKYQPEAQVQKNERDRENSQPEPTQSDEMRKKEIIAAAELAVIASKKTGNRLPGYFYDLAGVKRPRGVTD